tara:strand:+ start:272 stop:1027 length:756 start_codon:yes stop_codon:yes gene_type:complete
VKKIIILILIIFLTSCVQLVNLVDQQELKDGLVDDINTPSKESIKVTEKTISTPDLSLDSSEKPLDNASALISNSSKVTSFAYSDLSDTKDSFSVKGNKVRVKLGKKISKNKKIYNIVLLDLDEGTAYGYCTDNGVCDSRARGVYYKVNYSGYNEGKNPLLIPNTWKVKYLTGNTHLYGKKITVWEVEFIDNKGRKGLAQIDNYYGVPYEIVYRNDDGSIEKRIEFVGLNFNTVDDEELEIPRKLDLSTFN